MQSADERHVTSYRPSSGRVYSGARVDRVRGINQVARCLLQTMPRQTFEEVVLPHLDAAFNYARWLTKSEADAEDVVQDACVRALRFFSSFASDDARAWLLTIVRNTRYGRFPQIEGRGSNHGVRRDDSTISPTKAWIRRRWCCSSRRSRRCSAPSRNCRLIFAK